MPPDPAFHRPSPRTYAAASVTECNMIRQGTDRLRISGGVSARVGVTSVNDDDSGVGVTCVGACVAGSGAASANASASTGTILRLPSAERDS
jgi:hypothetical protein